MPEEAEAEEEEEEKLEEVEEEQEGGGWPKAKVRSILLHLLWYSRTCLCERLDLPKDGQKGFKGDVSLTRLERSAATTTTAQPIDGPVALVSPHF
ncbi:hypothetical protein HZH66_011287 [Vespula vulgaris]|uniref:Uncharacterized protein n=2 Tax=Vespula TaxID=7451 RepID=A0A834MVJ8_VESVU|nr:hypothetical protein HZH66_011287 [Vespula vulgaris]